MTAIWPAPSLAVSLSLVLVMAACSSCGKSSSAGNGGGGGGQNPSYTTNFPLTEAVISEGGKWINGGVAGLDWDNVQTATNFAFGTLPTGKYTDPTAVLTGTWGPDQMAQATVRIKTVNPDCCHEVELHLRTTIVAHSITGYEINCSVATGNRYIEIVRWNGPINSFDYVARNSSTGCADGDVLQATITGSTITVYKNGAEVLQGMDANYASGAPGIGFYETDNNIGYYGFSSFTASNVGSQHGKLLNQPHNALTRGKPTVGGPYDGFRASMTDSDENRHLIRRGQSAAPCHISTHSRNLQSKTAAQREASCVL